MKENRMEPGSDLALIFHIAKNLSSWKHKAVVAFMLCVCVCVCLCVCLCVCVCVCACILCECVGLEGQGVGLKSMSVEINIPTLISHVNFLTKTPWP